MSRQVTRISTYLPPRMITVKLVSISLPLKIGISLVIDSERWNKSILTIKRIQLNQINFLLRKK